MISPTGDRGIGLSLAASGPAVSAVSRLVREGGRGWVANVGGVGGAFIRDLLCLNEKATPQDGQTLVRGPQVAPQSAQVFCPRGISIPALSAIEQL